MFTMLHSNAMKTLAEHWEQALRPVIIQRALLCSKFWESSSLAITKHLVIPCNMNSMKEVVLWQCHNQGSCLGVSRRTKIVKQRFYWPGYYSDIKNWVCEFQQCQQHSTPWYNYRHPPFWEHILGHHGVHFLQALREEGTFLLLLITSGSGLKLFLSGQQTWIW